jgi:hypothetical protein
MTTVVRAVITYGALIAILALLIALARHVPGIKAVTLGVVWAFVLIGSLAKLWRVIRHGDYTVTGNVFWLPKRWQAWMVPKDLNRS